MVDIKNLNRIKGILSAKQGAEIPKFNPGGPLIHTVGSGETLSQIVDMYNRTNNLNLKLWDVASWNNIKDPNKIQIGQVINLTNPNQQTSIPGANPSEGDPNAALKTSADVMQQASAQNTQTQAQNLSKSMNLQQSGILTDEQIKASATAGLQNGIILSEGITDMTNKQAADYAAQVDKKQKQQNAANAVGGAVTAAFQSVGSIVGAKQKATDSALTKSADQLYDTTSEAIQNLGPAGQVVGTAMKFAGMAGDAIQELGGGTDQQTKLDKWMDSSFFSWNIGMLNGFAGKNTQDFGVDQDILANVGSSYGGTASDLNEAADKAGKKYGLFSTKARKKADKEIASARNKQNLMGDISDTASDQRLAVQSMGEQAGIAYSIMTGGGYDQKYTYAAKNGGSLEWNPVLTLEWEPRIELNWELPEFKEGGNIDLVEDLEQVPELKSGGKTKDFDIPEIEETTQKNVIPEGALHKNKHHMEHAEGLTKKGIPVIDDNREQQAEIEHSEIIFTLEVTKKLEEYYEIFYSENSSNKEKEQAALDAGRLLVYQILENTEDRTGLIESCKKGGSLTLKKSVDDLIEEVSNWIPSITIIVETSEEEKPDDEDKKPQIKSEKNEIKEAIKEVLIELLTK